jgi:hypothetical protein
LLLQSIWNLAACLPTTVLPQWCVLLVKRDCLNYFSENGTLLFSRSQCILNQFSSWFSLAFVTISIQFCLSNWYFKGSWWCCLSWGVLFSTLKNETVFLLNLCYLCTKLPGIAYQTGPGFVVIILRTPNLKLPIMNYSYIRPICFHLQDISFSERDPIEIWTLINTRK